jgi:hypothetical protein
VPGSRAAWGAIVFLLGCLWALGGVAGLLTAQNLPWPWLYLVLGLVLARLGWNLRR